jgi:hypothetical protein
MDNHKIYVFWESIRFVFGIELIFYLGDWFGMNQLFHFASYVIGGYLLLYLDVPVYFVSSNSKKETLIVTLS